MPVLAPSSVRDLLEIPEPVEPAAEEAPKWFAEGRHEVTNRRPRSGPDVGPLQRWLDLCA